MADWLNLSDAQRLLISGGVAGSVSKTLTAPLSRLTILYQVHSLVTTKPYAPQYAEGLVPAIQKVIGKEGFLAFWKGNGTSVIHRFPYSAINFYLFENFKRYLRQARDVESDTTIIRLSAGATSGAIACSVCYPLDLVRTRLATQLTLPDGSKRYRGIIHAHLRIVSEEGILGLYSGICTTLTVQVPNLAISYSVYGFLKDRVAKMKPISNEKATDRVGVNLCCGAASGISSTLVTYPADVVRRRMQLQSLHRSPVDHRTPLQEVRHITRFEGMEGLYRGLTPELLKVVPMVGCTFMVYELLMDLL